MGSYDGPRLVGEAVMLDLSSALYGPVVTWEDAEALGLALMLTIGFSDARLTNAGADAGIDIDGREGVCQVKHWTSPVGRREVQQLAGAAGGRDAVFLAGRYTTQASSWAAAGGVALFTFDLEGHVQTLNAAAVTLAGRAVPQEPLSDRQQDAMDRVQRAHRWLYEVTAEARMLMSETPTIGRQQRQHAMKVYAFNHRLPQLQTGFAKIEEAANLRVAPLARLESRLTMLEHHLREAARTLGIRLSN